MHPCVLHNIGPLGPLPCSHSTFFSLSLQAGHRGPLTMCNHWKTCLLLPLPTSTQLGSRVSGLILKQTRDSSPFSSRVCSLFSVAYYPTLHPGSSVRPSIHLLVHPSHFTFSAFMGILGMPLLPKCSPDLKYGPLPPTRDLGCPVSGLSGCGLAFL